MLHVVGSVLSTFRIWQLWLESVNAFENFSLYCAHRSRFFRATRHYTDRAWSMCVVQTEIFKWCAGFISISTVFCYHARSFVRQKLVSLRRRLRVLFFWCIIVTLFSLKCFVNQSDFYHRIGLINVIRKKAVCWSYYVHGQPAFIGKYLTKILARTIQFCMWKIFCILYLNLTE